MHRTRLLAALAAALALVPAATASADSIAYIKGGDVWKATPDGARQVQLTKTGTYSYVSQADDGSMIALAPGERLHRLATNGRLLADFPTFVSDGAPQAGPVTQFHGPFAPEISPDGKLVAFEWYNRDYQNTAGCSDSTVPPCFVLYSAQGVGITRSDAFTAFTDFGLMTGWIGPQWLGNDKIMRSSSNRALNEDTVFNEVGPGKGDDAMDRWFFDNNASGLYEAELSRDRRVVAGIAGMKDEHIGVYRPLVEPFGAKDPDMSPFAKNDPLVEMCFAVNDPVGGKFTGLSLSPDGRRLAFADGSGINVVEVPDFSGGCAVPTQKALVVPGARHPHWGPADVPAAAADDAPPPPRPEETPDGGATGLPVTVKAPRTAKAGKPLKVVVLTPGTGKVTVTARAKGRRLAKATATTTSVGATAVLLRFGAAAKRLARKRPVKVALTVDYTGYGGPSQGGATLTLSR